MTEFFDLVGTEQRVYYPCQRKLGNVYNCINLLTTDDNENKCEICSGNLVTCICELNMAHCVSCTFMNEKTYEKYICPRLRISEVSTQTTIFLDTIFQN